MQVQIDITKGPDAGRKFELSENQRVVIGRGDDVEVRMIDTLISRSHCELLFDGQRLLLKDLSSTNKTFIQQDLTQPIIPQQYVEIRNGECFFVGPESRFTASYVPERTPSPMPQAPSPIPDTPPSDVAPPMANTGAAPMSSNFTESMHGAKSSSGGLGASSIFNLLGPTSSNPGILDDDSRAKQPPPPVQSSPSSVPSGYDGSIAPPHLQGQGNVLRPQLGAEEFVDDVMLKSTPPTPQPAVPSKPAHDSREPQPSAVPELNSSQAAAKRVQPVTEPQAAPAPAPNVSSPFSESIAMPGQVYEEQPTHVAPIGNENPTTLGASTEQLGQVSGPAPERVSPVPDNRQSNGLYFHRGQELEVLPHLITELSSSLAPIYCVDFSRLDLPVVDSKAESVSPPTESGDSLPPEGNQSAFDLEEDTSDSAPSTETTEPEIDGQPLFSFLPEGMQQNGPMLQCQDEFRLSLDMAWQHDAIVTFFGQDPNLMTSHLRELLHTNIQNGKRFKGMFGFCWPSVLHTTFESQGAEQVARIFGDCITCVLIEDPMQRHAWNLIARSDLSNEIKLLANG